MRHLRSVGLIAVLAAGSVPVAVADNIVIMPLAEVQPGMKGVGYSVFNGVVRSQFDFVVRGKVPDFQMNEYEVWPWVITVQLSGGPRRPDGTMLFDKNLIYAGMSGSPMFIDGKLIGGLMSSANFNTAAQAAVTPIELMMEMIALSHDGTPRPATVQPGSYVAMCYVYGDSDRCTTSTVTGSFEDHVLMTAHSVGIPYGTIRLPAFERSVADLIESQAGASKLSGELIRPIGTAVVHGMFGTVVHEGELPVTVPVRLTIAGVYQEPLILNYHMAYHKQATAYLRQVLNTAIGRLPVDPNVAGIGITVRLAEPSGSIVFTDGAGTGISSLEQLLDRLIDQEGDKLRIDGIDLTYHRLPEPYLWSPLAITIDGKKNLGKVTILARRSKDNAMEQMSASVDLGPLKPYRRAKTQWLDGTNMQNEILKLLPVRDAIPLLDQIRDRDALYFVVIETDERIGIDTRAGDGVVRRVPTVTILLKQKMGDRRFNADPSARITFKRLQ